MIRLLILVLGLSLLEAADPAPVAAVKTRLATAIATAAPDDKVKAFVTNHLLPLTTNATWVEAVLAQNAKATSLEEIRKLDVLWQKAEEELPIQLDRMGNACAKACKETVKRLPALKEVFVMDNQGANVGQNALTSDYWQGDEDKWTKSFNGGQGGVDVGKVKFDQSANVNLQQVSLPIIAADGTIIGAVCFGIDIGTL